MSKLSRKISELGRVKKTSFIVDPEFDQKVEKFHHFYRLIKNVKKSVQFEEQHFRALVPTVNSFACFYEKDKEEDSAFYRKLQYMFLDFNAQERTRCLRIVEQFGESATIALIKEQKETINNFFLYIGQLKKMKKKNQRKECLCFKV